ncbi:MAG TPA: DUF2130 domain-containing protein [Silvibacterium sp.]|nr:DUF2130 domain-containing protein [Silvibacterium sp.]
MELNREQCPLCGTELSGVKFNEIQGKLRRSEADQAAELKRAEVTLRQALERQFKEESEKQRHLLETKARNEADARVKAITTERDQAASKAKEAEAREGQIRELAKQELAKEKIVLQSRLMEEADIRVKQAVAERDNLAKKLIESQQREGRVQKEADEKIQREKRAAETRANAEVAERLNKLTMERDQAATKIKQAEAREELIRKEARQNAEKEIASQRQSLETDKNLALLKQQSEFNRQRESWQAKLQLVEKQLQKKTANELGDGPEIDLYETLREVFQGDKIVRVRKGQPGPDIIQDIMYKGNSCGRIVIDSKNRQGWQHSYVTKLRQDQTEAGAEHAILASTAFPAGKKEMCIESDVIVISPGRVVHVVQLLRNAMVTMHVRGLSVKERSTKMARLYKLITSDSYSQKLAEAKKLNEEILELDVQEKKTHDNVWKKRGSLAKRVQNVLRDVETEVGAVIEGGGEEEVPPPTYAVQRESTFVARSAQEVV